MSPRREALTWEYVVEWCTANQVRDESKICDDHGRWLVAVGSTAHKDAILLEFSYNEIAGRQVITLSRLKEIVAEDGTLPAARLLVEDEQSYFRIVDLAEGWNEDGVQDTLRLQRRYR